MCIDAEADVLSAEASSAICVQKFDDSRNSAIHTTYRILLRSSSVREPRHPLLRVVFGYRVGHAERIALDQQKVWGQKQRPNRGSPVRPECCNILNARPVAMRPPYARGDISVHCVVLTIQ